jgi:hypothetical protein
MAERRVTAGAQTGRTTSTSPNVEEGTRRMGTVREMERGLRIDRDDLDSCLIEQPDRYYHVAAALAAATADRDAAKLDLDATYADLDRTVRAEAEKAGEKTTEARIQQEIKLDRTYDAAKRRIADLDARIGALQALKEAFSQRSFMLRELVALVIAERSDLAGVGGAYEARARRASTVEAARADVLGQRRPRRGEG